MLLKGRYLFHLVNFKRRKVVAVSILVQPKPIFNTEVVKNFFGGEGTNDEAPAYLVVFFFLLVVISIELKQFGLTESYFFDYPVAIHFDERVRAHYCQQVLVHLSAGQLKLFHNTIHIFLGLVFRCFRILNQ